MIRAAHTLPFPCRFNIRRWNIGVGRASFDGIIDERFRAYVLPNAPLVKVGEGFAWLEGPVWFADQDCLLVSDLPNDRILRWTRDGGAHRVSADPPALRTATRGTRQGRHDRLFAPASRCITRTELDGSLTVLADRYQGKRLNSPVERRCLVVGRRHLVQRSALRHQHGTTKAASRVGLPPYLYRLDPRDGSLRCDGG